MTELDFQREQTAILIAESGVNIALSRAGQSYQDDGAGGQIPAGSPQALDPVRRYFHGVAFNDTLMVTQVGDQIISVHVLIGKHDDDIRQGDEFTHDGRHYKVNFVHPDRSYQTKAEVAEYGVA